MGRNNSQKFTIGHFIGENIILMRRGPQRDNEFGKAVIVMCGPQRDNEFGKAVIVMRGPQRDNEFRKAVIDNVYTLPRFARTSEKQRKNKLTIG